MKQVVYIFVAFTFLLSSLMAQQWTVDTGFPEELGNVNWHRSYDKAINSAKAQNTPVFILFQEVPGCATCKNYGNNLLTHPHIVEAIETYFTPLAIYNNKQGSDADILRKFNEPSWNNPVARIIDPNSESDLVKRLNGRYDMESLVSFVSKGIIESGSLIPEYFDLLYQEVAVKDVRETHLSMYCFWSGESPEGTFRPDGQPKYYTYNTEYRYLPMTSLQALKVNSAISKRESPDQFLSPRQIEVLALIKNGKIDKMDAIDKDFTSLWNRILR